MAWKQNQSEAPQPNQQGGEGGMFPESIRPATTQPRGGEGMLTKIIFMRRYMYLKREQHARTKSNDGQSGKHTNWDYR